MTVVLAHASMEWATEMGKALHSSGCQCIAQSLHSLRHMLGSSEPLGESATRQHVQVRREQYARVKHYTITGASAWLWLAAAKP